MINFLSKNEFQTEFDGVNITVRSQPKENQFTSNGHSIKTRVYVWFDKGTELSDRFDWKMSDPYEIVNKIYHAKHKWQKKYVVEPLVKLFEFDDDAKVSFSSKAGCQCGCSPGFIVKSKKQPPFDLFVHIH